MRILPDADCAIIIVTYNGIKWIEKCIASCMESEYPVEIVVVDNCSTDNTLELLPKKGIHLLSLKENIGFGRANNVGMKWAMEHLDAKYVFLLNQDAYLGKHTIGGLVDCYHQYPDLGLISPFHYDGLRADLDYRFKIYIRRAKKRPIGKVGEKYHLYKSKFVNAAGWFLPTKVVAEVGGFDPIFFHTGEDDNLCHRLMFRGYTIGITDAGEILHDRQDRVIKSYPPYIRVLNRCKILLYNVTMNPFRKYGEIFLFVLKYGVNLTYSELRTKKKLEQDYQGFTEAWKYLFKHREIYKQKGPYLDHDYPQILDK